MEAGKWNLYTGVLMVGPKIYVYGRGGAGGWIFGRQLAFLATEIFPYGYGC